MNNLVTLADRFELQSRPSSRVGQVLFVLGAAIAFLAYSFPIADFPWRGLSITLQAVGLGSEIVGAVLLFRHGLPPGMYGGATRLRDVKEQLLAGVIGLEVERLLSPEAKERLDHNVDMVESLGDTFSRVTDERIEQHAQAARLGICLLILGFAIQLVGVVMQFWL